MATARRVGYKILYDGAEVGLSGKCESISYTDNDSGAADEITLNLIDRNSDWAIGKGFVPEKEHDLDVTMYFHNMTGAYQEYHCGNFTIDDISYSGGSGGHKCSIKGISLPASQSFQTSKVSKTWEKVTVKQIAEEIKGKYGMTDLYFWAGEPIIDKVDQEEQTDSEFISNLCNDQGLCIKIYKKALVIFDKAGYEARGITATFSESDFEEWSWNSTLVGTYTGAKISYTQVDKNETDEKKKTKVISVTVGEEPRMLVLNEKAESKEEAERIAKAKVNAENEKAVSLEFMALGNANIVASCNIEVKDMGRIDGKYYVTKVSHELSGSSGHKMSVSAYRIFPRL
nr:MAG TPA: tail protein [Caudoviricetes sp.]